MCSSCAIISSIHSAEHAFRESTSCVLYMTSHAMHTIKCRNYKPRLLFKSGLCVGMQLQKCGFYSRAAFIQDFMVYMYRLGRLDLSGCSTYSDFPTKIGATGGACTLRNFFHRNI